MVKPELIPPVRSPIVAYYGSEAQSDPPSVWPFSIRERDQDTFGKMVAARAFSSVNLVTLGTVGSEVPGIRSLAQIAETAQVLELMRAHGLGKPRLSIFYPVHINAWANDCNPERNLQLAKAHHEMVNRYLEIFHPDVSRPIELVDNPGTIPVVAELGRQIIHTLSAPTKEILKRMARNHSISKHAPEDLDSRIAGYLLAHFFLYGWAQGLNYVDLNTQTPFSDRDQVEETSSLNFHLVPESEAAFLKMIEKEFDGIAKSTNGSLQMTHHDHLGDRRPVIAFSDHLRTAPYLLHNKEPDLRVLAYSWQKGGLGRRGINGLALTEIYTALDIVTSDIHNQISILQRKVLQPFVLNYITI